MMLAIVLCPVYRLTKYCGCHHHRHHRRRRYSVAAILAIVLDCEVLKMFR